MIWGGLGGVAAGFAAYTHFARDLPALTDFDEMTQTSVSRFVTKDGQRVGEWYDERRLQVRWADLPDKLILAFLAAEDARFFAHSGIDIRGVVRAMLANLQAGTIQEGASTITQQLAKTLVGAKKSYERKVREAILARRMEDIYSKEQILTWYLNAIYLGHHSYGVQAAAQNYFRKNVWELELAEMAMLAGLPQSPSRVNPVVDPPGARERMLHVLEQMERRGWISAAEADEARAFDLIVHPRDDLFGDHVPYYTSEVRKRIDARYPDWMQRGLTVSMHVDPALQRLGSAALSEALEDLAKRQGYPGALGQLERDDFLARSRPWLPATLSPGTRVLARVSALDAKRGTVELSADARGRFTLKETAWAGPWTRFPVDAQGRPKREGRVSFKPKLKDLREAFAVSDVILVEVGEAPDKDGAPLPVRVVPVPMMEGALVSYPTSSGGVDTLVGGWDFDRSEVNRAFAVRQTGSTMKPIVYSKAYDLGLPPSALFSGAPFREGKYNPTGAKSKRDMIVWDALTRSENSVSLRVLQYVLNHTSLADYKAWGQALGLSRPLQGNPAEILGADHTPFDIARVFGTFARRGRRPDLHLIRKVTDRDGRILERSVGLEDPNASLSDTVAALVELVGSTRAPEIPSTTAYLTTANLARVVQHGTGKRAKTLHHEAAGKTGTLPYDVWFSGFTGHRVAVAWIGADRRRRVLGKSEKVNKVYGGDTALPAWLTFMAGIDHARPVLPLTDPTPPDVTHLRIDPKTGLLARKGGRIVPHRKGTEPSDFSPDEESPEQIDESELEF